MTKYVEALLPTGSVIHAGKVDRQRKDGWSTWIPVVCHAGMSRRFDVSRRFEETALASPLLCKRCIRIIREERRAVSEDQ